MVKLKKNIEIFEIKLSAIQEESIGLKIELRNNFGIIPLSKLAKEIGKIKDQARLADAISQCRSCTDYISEYLSIILIENHRVSRNANYRIEEVIALYIKHYVDGTK